MERAKKELLVARICSGCVRITVTGAKGREKTYLVRRPGREECYIANEVYFDMLRESELEGLYSDEELLAFLLENGFWDEQRQKLLDCLPKEIEEFKVKLFKSTFKSNERKVVRKALAVAKEKLTEVSEARHAYDYLSCSGAAALAKARAIMGCSLCTSDGRRVFAGYDDFLQADSSLLDDAMAAYARTRLDESDYRELARNDPWRTLWNAHKVEGKLFGISPADYTEEQVCLVNWSSLYDNVYQSQDCPSDEAIADDDVLDGWMIEQRRQREQRQNQAQGEDMLGNEKIKNSQEVYLVAETVEDARKVVDLNDDFAKAVQKHRFNTLKKKGVVNELDMPDTRQRLRMEITQKLSQTMKQG
jgi:hypothetical protein